MTKSRGSKRFWGGNVIWFFLFFWMTHAFKVTLKSVLPSLFPVVEPWTKMLSGASGAYGILDVALGSFMSSWMSHWCTGSTNSHEGLPRIPSFIDLWLWKYFFTVVYLQWGYGFLWKRKIVKVIWEVWIYIYPLFSHYILGHYTGEVCLILMKPQFI